MKRGGDAEDAQPTHVCTLGLRFESDVCQAAKRRLTNIRLAVAQGM